MTDRAGGREQGRRSQEEGVRGRRKEEEDAIEAVLCSQCGYNPPTHNFACEKFNFARSLPVQEI